MRRNYWRERYERHRRSGASAIVALRCAIYGVAWPYYSPMFYDELRDLVDAMRPKS